MIFFYQRITLQNLYWDGVVWDGIAGWGLTKMGVGWDGMVGMGSDQDNQLICNDIVHKK
jgi:hypothetical protein